VRYLNGRGRRLRRTDGAQVGGANVKWNQIACATLALIAASNGVIVLGGTPARLNIRFEPEYLTDPARVPPPTAETLWRPDPALGTPVGPGFPVLPGKGDGK
jgi:hypothetical protein